MTGIHLIIEDALGELREATNALRLGDDRSYMIYHKLRHVAERLEGALEIKVH